MAPFVYVATPIDYADGTESTTCWEIGRACKQMGWVAYNPAHAFATNGATPDHRVQKVHYRALNLADGLIAHLPEGVRSIGVPMEIAEARTLFGIPVVVIGGEDSWALQKAGIYLARNVAEAIGYLDNQMNEDRQRAHVQPLRIKAEQPQFEPIRLNGGDAGFDLFVSERTVCPGAAFTDVPAGIRLELPEGYWGLVIGRSSTLRKRGLMVMQSVIDQGWRGPMFAGVWNMAHHPVTLEVGERVAQLIPIGQAARHLQPVLVDELGPGDRGDAGFGSSGA